MGFDAAGHPGAPRSLVAYNDRLIAHYFFFLPALFAELGRGMAIH